MKVGKGILGKVNSQLKDPEAGTMLACLRNKVSVAGAGQTRKAQTMKQEKQARANNVGAAAKRKEIRLNS